MFTNYIILLLFSLCLNNVIGGNLKSEKESGSVKEELVTKMLLTWMNETDFKLNSIGKQMNNNLEEKLRALEKYITDKLEQKVDALQNNMSVTVTNSVEQKCNKPDKNRDNSEEKLEALEKNIHEKLQQEVSILQQNISVIVDNSVNQKLEEMVKIMSKNLKEKLEDLEKNIHEKLEASIDKKLNALQQNIPIKVKENMDSKFNELEKIEKQALQKIVDLSKHQCKEQLTKGYNFNKPLYHMDNATYNHIKRNASEYFEMHIAIKAGHDGVIALSATDKVDYNSPVFEIVVGGGGNTKTVLRWTRFGDEISVPSPSILCSTDYTPFYIKISGDQLTFGKEGGSTLIVQSHRNFKAVQYFGFASWNDDPAAFLYDCPN